MPSHTLTYLLALPVVYLLFYFVGERARWCFLLAVSLLFYAALKVAYLPAVLALVTLTTYGFGIWLAQAGSPQAKYALLWCGIATNVLVLVVMKYLPFLSESLSGLLLLLPFDIGMRPVKAFISIGVSYYVFQAISYLLDIYLDIEKPERHLGYFALYLAFFPKLLQGPIERASDLIPQLKSKYRFDYDNVRCGMLLFAWGLFKKVVIADRLAPYVDRVYNDVHAFTGLPLLLGTYAYAFQIYLDFSGYTDMALGCAQLFNINLTQNFNSPYLATSVADFWRRWHISFSRWILDYIFRPLQMKWRNWKNWGSAAALLVAFLVSGLWHGASWGFVIWGGLHGLYMACSLLCKPYVKKLHKVLGIEKTRALQVWQILVTFNLVSFAWIFFRSANLQDAVYVVSHLLSANGEALVDVLLSRGGAELSVLLLVSLIYLVVKGTLNRDIRSCNYLVRWAIYITIFNGIVYFEGASAGRFIYAQF